MIIVMTSLVTEMADFLSISIFLCSLCLSTLRSSSFVIAVIFRTCDDIEQGLSVHDGITKSVKYPDTMAFNFM